MLRKLLRNKKILIIIDIILLMMAIKGCRYIYETEIQKIMYTSELEKFVSDNENPVFKISKIILYSSAYAEDNSLEQNLEDINISQYTDIAIYLDNKSKISDITAENTINEIYIDNIKVRVNSEEGEHIFNYKNANAFGKFLNINNCEDDKIDFQIITSNKKESEADYDDNVFFTDCSNPITLQLLNKDFLTHCQASNVDGSILFDGSILKNANVDLNSISGKVSFLIHIKNNLGENFICNLTLDNNLNEDDSEILNGYHMKIIDTQGEEFNFVKIPEN